jgi:hypothetical protein
MTMSTMVVNAELETTRLVELIERMSRSGRGEREIDAAVRHAAGTARRSGWWQRLKELAGAAAA